ncbi:hypothetical protein J6590_000205 [Homalodisca vitripennis]|nr:hypothetical protein J6590_000205 [Homalodisca vitripennis]
MERVLPQCRLILFLGPWFLSLAEDSTAIATLCPALTIVFYLNDILDSHACSPATNLPGGAGAGTRDTARNVQVTPAIIHNRSPVGCRPSVICDYKVINLINWWAFFVNRQAININTDGYGCGRALTPGDR